MTAVATQAAHIPEMVERHADEAAFLWLQRRWLTAAPHINLAGLARHDERLAAQIDGVQVAGDGATTALNALLDPPGPGAIFVAAVLALEQRQHGRFHQLVELAVAAPALCAGLNSALGWVSPGLLQGVASGLLADDSPLKRSMGLAACALHRIDAGEALAPAIAGDSLTLKSRGLRTAGDLGRLDLLPLCLSHVGSKDGDIGFQSARSAVLLGDRGVALDALRDAVAKNADAHEEALAIFVRASQPAQGHAFLASALRAQGRTRELIRGSGLVGAIRYVPWLLRLMGDPLHARVAGDAFSMITGLDLAAGHDTPAPEDAASGPTDDADDADDADVAMDEDRDLPWPDASKITGWWNVNQERFDANTRYFLGAPPDTAHCLHVLKSGTQHRRRIAALHLRLLHPGQALFNCAAPARRQARQLADMKETPP